MVIERDLPFHGSDPQWKKDNFHSCWDFSISLAPIELQSSDCPMAWTPASVRPEPIIFIFDLNGIESVEQQFRNLLSGYVEKFPEEKKFLDFFF